MAFWLDSTGTPPVCMSGRGDGEDGGDGGDGGACPLLPKTMKSPGSSTSLLYESGEYNIDD